MEQAIIPLVIRDGAGPGDLHPRTIPVNRAGAEYLDILRRFQEISGLTDAEMIQMLTDAQARIAARMVDRERK